MNSKNMNIYSTNFKNPYSPLKPISKPSFKGYFACPIQELHMQPDCNSDFLNLVKELKTKCSKYFEIILQTGNGFLKGSQIKNNEYYFIDSGSHCWGQDNKVFLENNTIGKLDADFDELVKKLAKYTKLKSKSLINKEAKKLDLNTIAGGNFFIGKKPDGENIILLGKDCLKGTSKKQIAKDFDIKPENVFIISQPDFHIDIAVRPLEYPYVLVGDEKLTGKLIKQNKIKINVEEMHENKALYLKNLAEAGNKYVDADTIIKELEEQGFKPIRVPGLLGDNDINYMNAIVHQNADESLVYITNQYNKKTDKLFEKYIKTAVPQIKEVLFIGDQKYPDGSTFLSTSLKERHGGLHCMTNERPNFKRWNYILNEKNRNKV